MGYQMDTCKTLDKWELLNEEMDERAKAYLMSTVMEPATRMYSITMSMWPVDFHNVRVVTNLRLFIYDAIHCTQLENCWIEKRRFL